MEEFPWDDEEMDQMAEEHTLIALEFAAKDLLSMGWGSRDIMAFLDDVLTEQNGFH